VYMRSAMKFVIVMNFIADLMYTYLDPRVRLGASGGE